MILKDSKVKSVGSLEFFNMTLSIIYIMPTINIAGMPTAIIDYIK